MDYKTYQVGIKKVKGIPSQKSKQVIIAKYKEKTDWVEGFDQIPYVIYDKHDKSSPHYLPNIPIFPIEAFEGIKHAKTPTGRESHTYLYHIIKHYHELAEMNIFLQGNPEEIYSDSRDPLRILFERDFEGINFLTLNSPLIICDKFASPLHTGLPIERIFKRLFQNPCPDFFAYGWGATFCVSKEYIQQRPLCFYEEMMQIVYEEALSGYVFERLWPSILACHEFLHYPTYPAKNRASWNLPNLE